MAQTPPLAVRFKDATLEAIEAYREKAGVSRNRAVTDLVERGLLSLGSGLPTPARQAELKSHVARVQGSASKRAEALAQAQARENQRMAGWFSPRSKK